MYHLITHEEYANHDCHADPDDGCRTCVDYLNQIAILPEAIVPEEERQHYRLFGMTASEMNLRTVRNAAFRVYEMGYMSWVQYAEFCRKNQIETV